MWNSVIALEKCTQDDFSIRSTIVRLRHVACDTMMIGADMLDHVSST